MPVTRLLSLAFAAALSGALAGGARAQLIPPPEEGESIVTSKRVGNEVEMRDAENGAPLLMPKGIELWRDKNEANSLEPAITFQSQPAGFDVIYTFTNNGNGNRKLGTLNIGILTLGSKVEYPDLRHICEPLVADYNDNYKVLQSHYPDTLYSPAWVLQNDDYAVGVTVQYPILEYKHTVRFCLFAPEGKYAQGEGGRGWKFEVLLSNLGVENEINELTHSGIIKPGEVRTYVVSVRVTKKRNEWVRTLVPYRNWFRSEYGGVAYDRNPRPIGIRSCSTAELCSDENPFGLGDSRADLNGWGAIVSNFLEVKHWDTLLLSTPSGSYRTNTFNNMPFQFCSNWEATPAFLTAVDPEIGLPRIAAAGQKLGLWWGRSAQVADKWDDDVVVPFDPDNPNHRARAFEEMDLAVQAGATTIGLDSFAPIYTPVWKQIEWLRDMQARYPGVRFCAEPVSSDLIHREIPTFYRGNKDRWEVETPEDIDGFYNPHYLADFLLPGHEIWGSFRWGTYEEVFGIVFTDQEKTEKLEQIASLGYIPAPTESFDLKNWNIEAAESWKYTVPPDLQIDEDEEEDPFPTFELFHAAFEAGDMTADLNGDGKLTFYDYTAWQNDHLPGGKKGAGDDDDQTSSLQGPSAHPPADAAAKGRPARRASAAGSAPKGRAAAPKSRRMEVKVTAAPIGAGPVSAADAPAPPPARSRAAYRLSAEPVTFTDEELAAAIARARGLDPARANPSR